MEKWDKHQRKQHHSENPSFSSTLLDVIYRSIDEGTQTKEKEEQPIFYRETMRKQQNREDGFFGVGVEAEKPSFRRAKRVENRMETKTKEKPIMGRNSLTELERRTRSNSNTLSMHSSSSSSSESSSSIGGFSSSESESFYGVHKPKPIRTSVSYEKTNLEEKQKPKHHENNNNNNNNNNSFGKTKSKALRILYGDMKKAKPPVSPGARLASFLNSLFTSSGNAKKAKVSSSPSSSSASSCVHEVSISKSSSAAAAQAASSSSSFSTCSTVSSSFSRSCLSKTPSSRSGAKRSVRFCPVSVIVDEDCRPCGHKNLHEGEEESTMKVMKSYGNSSSSSKEELRFHVMQESLRVEELARELLKNYQKKNEENFHLMDCDDDDAASCSSSDLFELDNLSAIGIERYREELPVYETTHFNTNRAIANGFIM